MYEALKKAKELIKTWPGPQPGVPLHLRNAPTKLMKELGYSAGYKYTPKSKNDPLQNYLPEKLLRTKFFSEESS